MQFTNTSGVTSQTDTNQHNAGGELHAKLRNDEQHTSTPGPAGVEGAGGTGGHKRAWLRCQWAAAGPGRATHRHPDRLEAAARPAGPGRASSRRAERSSRRGRRAGGPPPTGTPSSPARQHTTRRPEHPWGHKQHEAARPHRGPGGSRIRPLGGSQRLFQRICVPAAPRRWQASTTRAAMPASADLPHVRGSYCFLMPTSPSILRTPS